MVTGLLTLACLLVAGQAPGEPVPIANRNFQIPIRIDEARRKEIKQLLLYVSSDQGQKWDQVAVAEPTRDTFRFVAPTDGTYWFNVCVVDLRGVREPADVSKVPPAQKVLIDTLKPAVRIVSAERVGDEVVVSWEIQEDHPDPATLKLEYRTPEAPSWMWTPVPVPQVLNGQARIRPPTSGALSLRMQMADVAGNVGNTTAEVKPGAEPITPAAATTPASPPPPVPPPSSVNLPPVPSPGPPPAPPAPVVREPVPAPVPAAPTMQNPRREAMDSNPATRPAALTPPESRPLQSEPMRGTPRAGAPANDTGSRVLASTERGAVPVPTVAPPGGTRQVGHVAPMMQITNSTHLSLDYDVTKSGPSGLANVTLYYTRDEGETWAKLADDPDLKSPITAELPGEGVYGFWLVLQSRAGRVSKTPQRGDPPQMRIEVDLTPPSARLFAPEPAPGSRDSLVLSWEATDRNLTQSPISLQWSADRNDWKPICTDIANGTPMGRYTWKLPTDIPVQVYLKLIVKDTAGNVSEATTQEPVTVDLIEPEGVLIGIARPSPRP
jgi:hypothetical protein